MSRVVDPQVPSPVSLRCPFHSSGQPNDPDTATPGSNGQRRGSASQNGGASTLDPARESVNQPTNGEAPGRVAELGWPCFSPKQFLMMAKDIGGYLTEAGRTDAPVVRLRSVPFVRQYLIKDPGLITTILKDDDNFNKGYSVKAVLGDFIGLEGLLLAQGETYRQALDVLRAGFSQAALDNYAPRIVLLTEEAARRWSAQNVTDVQLEMKNLAIDIMAQTLLGMDPDSDHTDFHRILRDFEAAMAERLLVPLPTWVPTPTNLRHRRIIAAFNEAVLARIDGWRPKDGDGIESRPDVFTLLVQAQRSGRLSREQVSAQVRTLLFAGHETSAALMARAIQLFALNPSVLKWVREELDEVLGARPVTAAETRKLDRMEKALHWVMRLYPPAWTTQRSPNQDIRVGGFVFPKGSILFLTPYVMHRDARFFQDPEEFDRRPYPDGEKMPHGPYFPFGVGPRACIGRQFAMLTAKLEAAVLCRQFDFTLLNHVEDRVGASIVAKDGIQIRFTPRRGESENVAGRAVASERHSTTASASRARIGHSPV